MIIKWSTATDVDVYKFTVPAGFETVGVDLQPLGVPTGPGTNGYGSGIGRVAVKVMQIDGTVIGAWNTSSTGYATAPDNITVPVTAGTDIVISIERPTGSTATANDFYLAFVDFSTDNPREMADATNNALATPEALALTVDTTDPKIKRGFMLGTIGTADVDFWSVPVTANDVVSVACGALRTGSGLTATYELEDATGAALQTETESATADIYWGTGTSASKTPVSAATTGYLIFKVTGTQDALVRGNWYRSGSSSPRRELTQRRFCRGR